MSAWILLQGCTLQTQEILQTATSKSNCKAGLTQKGKEASSECQCGSGITGCFPGLQSKRPKLALPCIMPTVIDKNYVTGRIFQIQRDLRVEYSSL
jgi:hypothetical protein